MPKADSVHSTPPLNTSALTPIAGLDWLDIAADAKPADIFRAIGKLRREARDEIDRLIRFLDDTEKHMAIDCEPCDDDGEGEDAEPFEMPYTDGEMLSFVAFDLEKRVKALRDGFE